MWPFKSKPKTDFKVTIIRKTITTIKETYTFKAPGNKAARIFFQLWWYKDHPILILNETEKSEQDIIECEADFLNGWEKHIIKKNLQSHCKELGADENEVIKTLLWEKDFLNL